MKDQKIENFTPRKFEVVHSLCHCRKYLQLFYSDGTFSERMPCIFIFESGNEPPKFIYEKAEKMLKENSKDKAIAIIHGDGHCLSFNVYDDQKTITFG